MTQKKIDPVFLKQHLSSMLGMDKTAANITPAARLAELAAKARENAEIIKTAMAAPKTACAEAAKKAMEESKKKKEEGKKAALEHIKLVTLALNGDPDDEAARKFAHSEVAIGILTGQLVAPYDELAKAAGIVTLNNLCHTYNQ